jgi:hypothetical protein
MNSISFILEQMAGTSFDQVNTFLSAYPGHVFFSAAAGIIPVVAKVNRDVSPGTLAIARKWHGSQSDKVSNINLLGNTINKNAAKWGVPGDITTFTLHAIEPLNALVELCKGNESSLLKREERDAMIRDAVAFCIGYVKMWMYGEYAFGLRSAEDIHSIGFLLPGETAKSHKLSPATDVVAAVSTRVVSADVVRVIVGQSDAKEVSKVVHSWPTGVRHALIVISDKEKKEVFRTIVSRLHTDVTMPEGSHGQVFYVNASFLKHTDDEPRFGPQPSFTMPYKTEDIPTLINAQREADVEEHRKDVEE